MSGAVEVNSKSPSPLTFDPMRLMSPEICQSFYQSPPKFDARCILSLSNDLAWLPAWLQPHQLLAFGDGAKDEHAVSQLSCKNMASLPKYISTQNSQLSTKGDDKYSGLHLYLSGGDSPPAGSIPSSMEGLHFHLHLSSLGISQLSKSQLNEIPQPENHETKANLSENHVDKLPAVQDDTMYKPKLGVEACASKSSMERELRVPCKKIKADQKNQKRLKGNPNNINIANAVELSIAASEAMVISDMVTSSLRSENLPAAAILEIALRVKQARQNCSLDILEVVSSFPVDEIYENDWLSDLDESTMADAYADVGITLTQIVESPDNSDDCRRSLQSSSLCDLNSRILESPLVTGEEAQSNKLKDGTTQTCIAASMPKYLALQPCPPQKTSPSALVPLDCIHSWLKSQPKVDVQNMQQNVDSVIPVQMGSKEDQEINKNGKLSELGDAIIKKSITVYNMETSFLSESMDVMDERATKHIEEAEPEIAASSNTPPRDLLSCPYNESQRSIHEGQGLSQDVVRSSILSSFDPFCSVVPCSISSEDAPISCEKFMEPKAAVSSKELNDNIVLSAVQEIPLEPLAEGIPILSKNSIEVPVVPNRMQFNSLRNYSMCSLSNAIGAEISFKPTGIWREMDESKENHGPGSKDQEKVRGPSALGEESYADFGLLFDPHEDRGPPIVLNNKKRRLMACSEFLNRNGEEEGLKNSLTSKIRKCKVVNSTNEVKWKDLTDFTSHVPLQSNLRSQPANEQSLKNKRVRFLEADISIDKTKNNNKLQNKHRMHGSRRRSSKRVKESKHLAREKGMIFQGLEFLLTGFSSQKEKELEALIRLYGGYVLLNIPSNPPDLRGKQRAGVARLKTPIVLSPKKVPTTKFLYGCATNTWMLNADWLVDSVHAGCLLPPWKLMIRPIQGSKTNCLRIGEPFCLNNHAFIFERVGIMVNGKVSFCTKFSKIIKHGGGKVFKSLQRLVQSLKNGTNMLGAVLVEHECNVSRHLKHYALENNLQTLPASWIINSLYSGKLLPPKDRYAPLHKIKMPAFSLAQDDDMSEEI